MQAENDFDKLAREADEAARKKLAAEIKTAAGLSSSDLSLIVMETGISKTDLDQLLACVRSATMSNENMAASIRGIHRGVETLTAIVKKLLI